MNGLSIVDLGLIVASIFCLYMMWRNHLVYREMGKMIDWHYNNKDSPYYIHGARFVDCCASYDEMLLKSWVYPLSKFYPEYYNWKVKNKDGM